MSPSVICFNVNLVNFRLTLNQVRLELEIWKKNRKRITTAPRLIAKEQTDISNSIEVAALSCTNTHHRK